MLSTDRGLWDSARAAVVGTATMARRVGLHYEDSTPSSNNQSSKPTGTNNRYVYQTESQFKDQQLNIIIA